MMCNNPEKVRELNSDFTLVVCEIADRIGAEFYIVDEDWQEVMYVPTSITDSEFNEELLVLAIAVTLDRDKNFEQGRQHGRVEERRSFQQLLGIDQVTQAFETAADRISEQVATSLDAMARRS